MYLQYLNCTVCKSSLIILADYSREHVSVQKYTNCLIQNTFPEAVTSMLVGTDYESMNTFSMVSHVLGSDIQKTSWAEQGHTRDFL